MFANREKLHHDRNNSGEDQLVRHALKRLGAEGRTPDVHAEVQYNGIDPLAAREKLLTFHAFHTVFPELPMRFVAPPATGYFTASPAQVADLLVKPAQSWLVQLHATAQAEQRLPSDQSIGLVFRYGGIRGGHVLHDGGMTRFGGGTPIPTGEHRLVYTRFYAALDALAAGAMRGLETPAATQVIPFDRRLPIPPSIRRELGFGVPSQVVALIEQLCSRQLPRAMHHWSHWIDGERWARCSQRDMAELIGCSAPAIKKSIPDLTERRLLEARRTVEGNAYRLGPAWREDGIRGAQ